MKDFTPLTEKQLKEIGLKPETVMSWFGTMPTHGIDDIHGMEDVKEALRFFCTQDDRKDQLGIQRKKAVLFHGAAGTGKTYYAEALVHELMKKGYRYMRLSAGDIMSPWVGVTEKIIGTVFGTAAECAPCVLLIDDIEAVCGDRNEPSLKNFERNITIAFLRNVEDYIWYNRNQEEKPVLLIGVATHPERLDPALWNRMLGIEVGLPDAESRKAYFEHYLDGIALESGLSYEAMSEQTEGRNYYGLFRIYEQIILGLREAAQQTAGSGEDSEAYDRDIREGKIPLTAEMFRSVLER